MKNTINSPIPTNIITGFLGVGKTTAIRQLLKNKPKEERWAVLVNEFGEVGVDGAFINSTGGEKSNIFVREVSGGCMCCTAGISMQIALAQLLAKAQPDRLLIEPTGLGHPIEVLQALSADHYKKTLKINNIITLVDARKISKKVYVENKIFNQQIAIADVIIANKSDLYQATDIEKLESYLEQQPLKYHLVDSAKNGKFNAILLDGISSFSPIKSPVSPIKVNQSNLFKNSTEPDIPESGFLVAKSLGGDFFSEGWRIAPKHEFDRKKLFSWLGSLMVERAKGVFITTDGIFFYNLADNILTETELDETTESRVEIISTNEINSIEEQLKNCLAV
jgi:G3E family GTPase